LKGGGLKYFDPELVDSFVGNKNSGIKVICSDLHIFCHNVSVQDKAKKKICVFTVTRPTLIFASNPMNFYTELG
jgi:hypothetical protein